MNELFLITSICLGGMIAPTTPDPTVSYVYYVLELDGQRKIYDTLGVPWRECLQPKGPTTGKIRLVDKLGVTASEVAMIEVELKAEPVSPAARADLNNDGIVGFADFSAFMKAWGSCNREMREIQCP